MPVTRIINVKGYTYKRAGKLVRVLTHRKRLAKSSLSLPNLIQDKTKLEGLITNWLNHYQKNPSKWYTQVSKKLREQHITNEEMVDALLIGKYKKNISLVGLSNSEGVHSIAALRPTNRGIVIEAIATNPDLVHRNNNSLRTLVNEIKSNRYGRIYFSPATTRLDRVYRKMGATTSNSPKKGTLMFRRNYSNLSTFK